MVKITITKYVMTYTDPERHWWNVDGISYSTEREAKLIAYSDAVHKLAGGFDVEITEDLVVVSTPESD